MIKIEDDGGVLKQRIKIEDDGSVLKQRNEELEQSIRNLKEERDDLMILNDVLVWEKNKAESETETWKTKCKELEIELLKLKKRLFAGVLQSSEMYSGGGCNVAGGQAVLPTETGIKATKDEDASGTRPVSTPAEQCFDTKGFKRHHRYKLKSTVRKCLDFAGPRNSIRDDSNDDLRTKRSRVGRGATFVVKSDSETNDNTPIGSLKSKNRSTQSSDSSLKKKSVNTNSSCHRDKPRKRRLWKLGEREVKGDMKECSSKSTGNQYNIGISENLNDDLGEDGNEEVDSRQRVGEGADFVVSNESETNDNIPIGVLKRRNQLTQNSDSSLKRTSANSSCFRDKPRRRHLRKVGDSLDKGDLKECSSKSTGNHNTFGISKNLDDDLGEDENEEDDSSSEGESLGDFIVGSSDASGTGSASKCSGMSAQSENVSSDSMPFEELICSLKRERKNKLKWDYEADMLADFAKCPELCMKAVCAIYRQQTAEEQSCKATIYRNGRGFSHAHSESGSRMAEFLTDGDPEGDLKKSVKELEEFDQEGVEQCIIWANNYSRQLFEIYKNKEDRFFHP